MSESAVARFPVYNPRPTLRIDEQEFDRARELVLAMDVREHESGLSSLELRLSNMASDITGGAAYAFENEEDLKLGSSIALYAGDANEPQEIFRGKISGLEAEFRSDGPPEILVFAEDDLQKMRMRRRTKLYSDSSLADIANTIAADHGLQASIDGLSENIGDWMQLNESDLAFLRRLAKRYHADVQIVADELQMSAINDVQRGELELRLRGQLKSVKFFADLSEQVSSVSVTGWDADAGQRIKESSRGQNLGPGNGRLGSEILENYFAERNEHVGHIAVKNAAEAIALANAIYDQRARNFVSVQATTEGNPQLRVGTHVRITGASERFENTYYVTSAQHIYDQSLGYQTCFTAQCAKLGNP
ncbi:phage protein D [Alteromonadaceae bacterium 2753L.S.0a.02]|nr:phage protein D [Alteromonadaceae bacterium 2753L.S.0a.02]